LSKASAALVNADMHASSATRAKPRMRSSIALSFVANLAATRTTEAIKPELSRRCTLKV
jgi:hypothetical protein